MSEQYNTIGSSVSLAIPDSEKNKEWHVAYSNALVTNSAILSPFAGADARRWAGYNGITEASEYNVLTMTSQGDLLPISVQSLNSIRPIIQNLLGEVMSRPLSVSVNAMSFQAISRKSEELLNLDVDFAMKPHAEGLMQATGMIPKSLSLPNTEDEFAEFKRNYKESGELFYTRLLKDNMVRNRVGKKLTSTTRLGAGDKVKMWLEEAIVSGRTFCQIQNIAGNIKVTDLDTRCVIFDPNCDEQTNNATYIGYMKYVPLSVARQEYAFTDTQIDTLRQNATRSGLPVSNGSNFGTLPYFATYNKTEYVLKSYVEWKDNKKKVGEIQNRNGREFAKIYDAELPKDITEKQARKIIKERQANGASPVDEEIVRHCCIYAGTIVISWGINKNMVRNVDNYQETGFTIKGYLPSWKNGYNVSLYDLTEPIGRVVNETWYKLRMALYQDRGEAMGFDVTQLPEEYTFEDIDYLGMIQGFFPLASQQHGIPSSFNQYPIMDRSLKLQRVNAYVTLIRVCQDFIKYILGFTDQRLGAVSASAANGATDMALQASANTTRAFYDGFDSFICTVLSTILGQLKIVAANAPERFADIVGDDGNIYLQKDIERTLDDYGAYVSIVGNSQAKKAAMDATTTFAVQNQMIDWFKGMQVIIEDDPAVALDMIKRFQMEDAKKVAEMQRMKQEQEQAAMQQQQQAMEQQAQTAQEATQQKTQTAMAALQANQALVNMKEQAATQRSTMDNRTALEKQQMADNAALQREVVAGNFGLQQSENQARKNQDK